MAEESVPNLKLDPLSGKKGNPKERTFSNGLLLIVLLLQAALLIGSFFLWGNRKEAVSSSPADALAIRELALTLEDKSLFREAAREWERYLDCAPDDPNRAQICLRAGDLRRNAGDYGEAARNYIAAELEAKRNGKELKADAGRKIVDCLRKLGRYGEVGRELARRVNVGKDSENSKTLATYAGEKITEADLDRMLERRVDQMMSIQGSSDADARKAILKQLNTPQARNDLLQEILRTELLARRARETGLEKAPSFRDALQGAESSLLASRYLEQELSQIQPTQVDLESYYEANKRQYEEPERAKVRILERKEKEEPPAIDNAEAFDKGAEREIVRGQSDGLLGETEKLFGLEQGGWTKKPIVRGEKRFWVFLEKKFPARTPPMEEIQGRVARDYVSRKRAELSQKLTRDLMSRYDVRILSNGKSEEK